MANHNQFPFQYNQTFIPNRQNTQMLTCKVCYQQIGSQEDKYSHFLTSHANCCPKCEQEFKDMSFVKKHLLSKKACIQILQNSSIWDTINNKLQLQKVDVQQINNSDAILTQILDQSNRLNSQLLNDFPYEEIKNNHENISKIKQNEQNISRDQQNQNQLQIFQDEDDDELQSVLLMSLEQSRIDKYSEESFFDPIEYFTKPNFYPSTQTEVAEMNNKKTHNQNPENFQQNQKQDLRKPIQIKLLEYQYKFEKWGRPDIPLTTILKKIQKKVDLLINIFDLMNMELILQNDSFIVKYQDESNLELALDKINNFKAQIVNGYLSEVQVDQLTQIFSKQDLEKLEQKFGIFIKKEELPQQVKKREGNWAFEVTKRDNNFRKACMHSNGRFYVQYDQSKDEEIQEIYEQLFASENQIQSYEKSLKRQNLSDNEYQIQLVLNLPMDLCFFEKIDKKKFQIQKVFWSCNPQLGWVYQVKQNDQEFHGSLRWLGINVIAVSQDEQGLLMASLFSKYDNWDRNIELPYALYYYKPAKNKNSFNGLTIFQQVSVQYQTRRNLIILPKQDLTLVIPAKTNFLIYGTNESIEGPRGILNWLKNEYEQQKQKYIQRLIQLDDFSVIKSRLGRAYQDFVDEMTYAQDLKFFKPTLLSIIQREDQDDLELKTEFLKAEKSFKNEQYEACDICYDDLLSKVIVEKSSLVDDEEDEYKQIVFANPNEPDILILKEIEQFLKGLENQSNILLLNEISIKGCCHTYHKECLLDHCKNGIDGDDLPIKCPGFGKCQTAEISEADLKLILPLNLLVRFNMLGFKKAIETANDIGQCPTADCTYCYVFEKGDREVLCPLCKFVHCVECKQEAHPDMTCAQALEQRQDNAFVNFANMSNFKQCTNCKHYIERTAGCNVMKCKCGYEFCFRCGVHRTHSQQTCQCKLFD